MPSASGGRWCGTSCTTTATTRPASRTARPLQLALATWPDGVTPKIHYSSPRTAVETRKGKTVLPPLRAHADLIDPIGFRYFLEHTAAGLRDFDVMLEAKAKDLALLRLREQVAA